MAITLSVAQIKELMEAFYNMSGIRFVLFDNEFREIISFPKENCDFCKMMKGCAKTRRKCNNDDRRSFAKCEKENALVIYNCHAGLVEAVMPLHENEKIIGYLMFGQITDKKDKENLYKTAEEMAEIYSLDKKELKKGIDKITYKSPEQISAAAKIMEACTSYIIYKELITPEDNKIIEEAKKYIEDNLEKEIGISDICKHLSIGRTRLYELFRKEVEMGVSQYIRYRRIHRAKKLLKTTELTVAQVAERVGFGDYNYFSRVFKRFYKKSPRSYRK